MNEFEPVEVSPTGEMIEHAPPGVDPDTPCPYFPTFLNGFLNWCARRVSANRAFAATLPPFLSRVYILVMSLLGFSLGLSLVLLPVWVWFVGSFSDRNLFRLFLLPASVMFIAEMALLFYVGFRVRQAAQIGEVRVFNSYWEIVGNTILFIIILFLGWLFPFMGTLNAVSSGGTALALCSGAAVISPLPDFGKLVAFLSLALLIHSCQVRNRGKGWKTVLAVFLTKFASCVISFLCVLRVFYAINRILHPVSKREAAINRIRSATVVNESANMTIEPGLTGPTKATNTAVESAIVAILTWILKVTLAPLVTGRPEGEPNGFSAAIRDFKAWRARNRDIFRLAVLWAVLNLVVSFLVLFCVFSIRYRR